MSTTEISTLRAAANSTDRRIRLRHSRQFQRALGDVVGFELPETFAAHRAVWLKQIITIDGEPSKFDTQAVDAFSQSLEEARRLGTKGMPDDPVAMTKLAGEAYDAYIKNVTDPEESAVKEFVILSDETQTTLQGVAACLQMEPGATLAIAGEYYAQRLIRNRPAQ